MKNLFLIVSIAITGLIFAQNKVPLTHQVYNNWESVKSNKISNDGNWVTYEINPYKGDGVFYIENPNTNKKISFERGYNASFSSESNFVVFKVKPQADTLRKKKLDKVKKKDLPKDSLFIYTFTGDTVKFNNIKSHNISKYNSNIIAFLNDKEKKKKAVEKDTTISDSAKVEKPKESKIKSDGTKLNIYYIAEKDTFTFDYVTDYFLDNYSNKLAFITQTTDSLDTTRVFVFDVQTKTSKMVFEEQGEAKKITLDEKGNQIAFIFSADTIDKKSYSLYYSHLKKVSLKIVADTIHGNLPSNYDVSPDKTISFSKEKGNLFFGIRPKPINEPKDTVLAKDKCRVDIWSWTDKRIMPQQLSNLTKDQKKSYSTVFYPKTKKIVQLEDTVFKNVYTYNFKDAKYGIARVNEPYLKLSSWELPTYADYYLINTETGKKSIIKKAFQSHISISSAQKYMFWYNYTDSCWYSKSIAKGNTVNLTNNIKVNFFDEYNDIPALPNNYGYAGWTKDDKYILIYDRYDIWKIDPTGKLEPVNITKGRDKNTKYRYCRFDRENIFVEESMYLNVFNKETMQAGYSTLDLNNTSAPKQLTWGDYYFISPQKAKNANKIIWKKMATALPPDLIYSDLNTQNIKVLTNLKPQQDKYIWSTSELISWVAYNGDTLKGMVFKPENFDPNKKYPMIVYFYEKYSDRINLYYSPKPSRSTINFTYFASNGYIVFVPDINYTTGHPGKDAYNAIVSGTEHMIKNKWINKDKIGIQGQSWGGYQVAYLVTKTNMYACAEAGAPVSNMTSAYGGIRWESGMSRMFQYEKTQSRIGGTLWDSRDLYIENSPVFFADKVETPLMIMHNDNDGAVPWYQGIEYFVALRRLNKPVWLINYNGDSHNLMKKPNMIDLSIRLSQFFDHYLKDAPAPDWMTNGVSALQKDKRNGYKLLEE